MSPLSEVGSGGGGGAGAALDAVTDMDTEASVDELEGPAMGVKGEADRSARDLDGPASLSVEAPAGVAAVSLFLRLRGLGGFSGPYPH